MAKSRALLFFLIFSISSLLPPPVRAIKQCMKDKGNGTCPNDNTCCLRSTRRGSLKKNTIPSSSSCITDAEENTAGVCCTDDIIHLNHTMMGVTGCRGGYRCSSKGSDRKSICELIEKQDDDEVNKPRILPRYVLCSIPSHSHLLDVYNFPIPIQGEEQKHYTSKKRRRRGLAYYSNKGQSLHTLPPSERHSIQIAIIVIHGSKRNADDYHCAMLSATSSIQKYYNDTENVLILTPWFASEEDGPISFSSSSNDDEALRWYEKGDYINHTWRFGSDSIHGILDDDDATINANNTRVSSFRVMDVMVEYLHNKINGFENLRRVVVVGHSAGGQFVHRWSLLSDSLAWGDEEEDGSISVTRTRRRRTSGAELLKSRYSYNKSISLRAVVANPKSYTYLDDRRWFVINKNNTIHKKSFHRPPPTNISQCPTYNNYQWGLSSSNKPLNDVPYKDRAIRMAGGVHSMVRRYINRNVVYLAGGLDVVPLGDTCEDYFQGRHHRERSLWYFQSLKEIFEDGDGKMKFFPQSRRVVEGVDHDHVLMFQSDVGIASIFGS